MSESELQKNRKAIDALDAEILALLNKRAEHARVIGRIKQENGAVELYDPAREAELLRRLSAANQGPILKSQLYAIYREIVSACLALEQTQHICYLGPEGTFTHMAALKHFGQSAQFSYRTTIIDLFDALGKDECDYVVAPIENSTEGMVSLTIDMLAGRDLFIIGELEIPIRHCLLGQSGLDLDAIKEVHAHEQALSQCRHWLRENMPHATLHKQPSNGVAVQMALNHNNAAAVGAQVNAQLYNLSIIANNVQDIAGNKTRFVVLGKRAVAATGKDKTALLFAVLHKPGALYRALGEFAKEGIDLTRLESRPLKTASWSYSFFVELRGHISDAHIARAVEGIEVECSFVKFLGSYPSIS